MGSIHGSGARATAIMDHHSAILDLEKILSDLFNAEIVARRIDLSYTIKLREAICSVIESIRLVQVALSHQAQHQKGKKHGAVEPIPE